MRTARTFFLIFLAGVLGLAGTRALAGFAGTDVFLPMVGRNAGVPPSDWYTTVWVHNPGPDAVTARMYFLERGKANLAPPWVDLTVGPLATEKYENVVDTLFHKQAFGAIRVTAPRKLVVTSRVYSMGASGGEVDSLGQDFAGVPASFAIGLNEKSQILGGHQTLPTADSEFRFNFGFVETTGHSATVRVTAYDAAGIEQGHADIPVREFSQRQGAFKDWFPTVSTENTRLVMEVISGSGKVIGYASGIANGSQDPTTFEMTYADELLATDAPAGITGLTAGAGLTGGGTSGAVRVDVGAGDGITVSADGISLADNGVSTLKLANAAVTDAKVAPGIAYSKLAGTPTALPPNGPAGGSLSGTYPNPGIANGAVSKAMLSPSGGSAGQVLATDGASLLWQTPAGGDISGVTAGTGLTGGGTGGNVTLSVSVPLVLNKLVGADPVISATHSGGGAGVNASGEFGVAGTGSYTGAYFATAGNANYAYVGVGGTHELGIYASGNTAGGRFLDTNQSGRAFIAMGDSGIEAQGNDWGGYFKDANQSGYAKVGFGDQGIWAYGASAGGFFATGEAFSGIASAGVGIYASGASAGGHFQSMTHSAETFVAYGDLGIDARGAIAGGHFEDTYAGSGANVGYDIYKIWGSGTVSFVQNHPTDPDSVIVYAAPEGDEVATYTRGSARLSGGEARVALGETFKWVTNPDLGLTAHVTPVGRWCDLYVVEKATDTLVVRSHDGSDCAFDYVVYGLRIGFEESTVVQEKREQAYIPSLRSHRERVAERPELARFTALARYGAQREALGAPEPLGLDRAAALKTAIHEFDPATDRRETSAPTPGTLQRSQDDAFREARQANSGESVGAGRAASLPTALDHPLDLDNKDRSHSFAEGPDMEDVHDGVAVLGATGEAEIELPDGFEALHRDFRYQLTCVGAPALVYVADEIASNRFRIAGGSPGLKVSWRVTGLRRDACSKQSPERGGVS